ncbi:MAG: A24 family peptidase [Alphaproteobacteria bacterium]|nr:A24 family peptidase [Alphaproteobacteria bacterium]
MLILQIMLYVFAAAFAVAMAVTDWRTRIIPDVFLFPFMLIGLLLGVFYGLPWIAGGIAEAVIAGCIGYALGFILNLIFKLRKSGGHDPIGLGDIKLLGAGGIWLGVTGLSIALVVACVIGLIWGLRARQKFVPFAPFFFMGGIAAIAFMMFA